MTAGTASLKRNCGDTSCSYTPIHQRLLHAVPSPRLVDRRRRGIQPRTMTTTASAGSGRGSALRAMTSSVVESLLSGIEADEAEAPLAPRQAVHATLRLSLEGGVEDAMRFADDARYELRVVGACESLGAWDPHRAPRLRAFAVAEDGQGSWAAQVLLPMNRRVEFKFVVIERLTGLVYWEPGRDRWLHRRCAPSTRTRHASQQCALHTLLAVLCGRTPRQSPYALWTSRGTPPERSSRVRLRLFFSNACCGSARAQTSGGSECGGQVGRPHDARVYPTCRRHLPHAAPSVAGRPDAAAAV